jgi:hypothetical protein
MKIVFGITTEDFICYSFIGDDAGDLSAAQGVVCSPANFEDLLNIEALRLVPQPDSLSKLYHMIELALLAGANEVHHFIERID